MEWIDVHSNNEAVKEIGAELEFVRERLHVVDEAGSVHVGSEAFAELWGKTPGQGFLARIVRAPILRPLSRLLYNAFAVLLYRWARQPTLPPALIVALLTLAAPFFIMQPGMGAGIAASKTSNPAQVRLRSILAHTVFGVGLYGSALLAAMLIRPGVAAT